MVPSADSTDLHRSVDAMSTRWTLALVLAVALVLGMTLSPESPWLFRWMAQHFDGTGSIVLARVLNVLLFVPLGVVLGSRLRPRSLWLVVALSLLVEVAQTTLANRNPDVLDVATNTIGGVLGYLLGRWWRSRKDDGDQPG